MKHRALFRVIFKAALSGIAGTAAMTILVNAYSDKEDKKLKVVQVLGTMLTNETKLGGGLSKTPEVTIIGTTAHYSVGVGFSLAYLFLWHQGITKPDFKNSVLLGFVSGLFGISVWRTFFAIHPHPPRIPIKKYLILLLISHVVFGVTTIKAFKMLQGEDELRNNF